MTQTCQTFGLADPSFTKSKTLRYLILLQPSDRSCSLVQPTSPVTETKSPKIGTPSQGSERNALISTCKRRMSLLRNKGSKRSGTILHAVPETTACTTALHDDKRDTTAAAYQDVSSGSQTATASNTSPALTHNDASVGTRSKIESLTSLGQPFQVKDLKSVLSNTSLKGAIGTYKHGKIQWRQKEHRQSPKETRRSYCAAQTSKPKIQVIIPRRICERPLPALPFFESPSKHHITTASIQADHAHDVSPPSASTKVMMRNSVVSPLNQIQPVFFGQFQRSTSPVIRKASVRAPIQRYPVSKPSGSSNDSHDGDSASTYSDGSSETSVEPNSPPLDRKHMNRYSVQNPVAAGVFDSQESYIRNFTPPSKSRPRQYAHHPPIEQDHAFQSSCPLRQSRDAPGTLSRRRTMDRKTSERSNRRRSLATNNGVIDHAISRSTSRQLSDPLRVASPTLSEAENELEEQLTSCKREQQPSRESIGLSGNDTDLADWCTIAPPAVPRKSSKRAYRMSRIPRDHIASQLGRGRSGARSQRLTITIPECTRNTEDFELSPIPVPARSNKRTITPSCAEKVILTIFRSLDHFDELFATAIVNKGFYRVFKRHELDLMRSTLKNVSPPAWEFREIAFPGHDMLHDEDLEMTRPQEEYAPASYIQLHKRDVHTMRCIKTLIKDKCQSFIRPEMATALVSDDRIETGRVDDALWRIWTFCKNFGSGKGREDDIISQQDWLKGGLMVHQNTCTFSITSTDYMNDTLISAPECFAKGNGNGLTAEQLFDMMELWNCLGVLLHVFADRTTLRTAQARQYGVFDNTNIEGGDIDGEEAMLGTFSKLDTWQC
jgi:hypothetical protein